MGCSLAASMVAAIKALKRQGEPGLLFVEPAEMVVSKEIKDVAAMAQRDIRFQFGPLLTLLDSVNFTFNWQERRPLLMGQIRDSDLVLLSRCDRVGQAALKDMAAELEELGVVATPLSVARNRGLNKVAQTIDAFGSTKAP